MYSLIFWDVDKSVSVVGEDKISGCNKEGGKVTVKYGDKNFVGLVLRISEDKAWLDKLKVSKTGQILARDKKQHPSGALAKKSLLTSARATAGCTKEVRKKRNAELLSMQSATGSEMKSVSDTDRTQERTIGEEKDAVGGEKHAVGGKKGTSIGDEQETVAASVPTCSVNEALPNSTQPASLGHTTCTLCSSFPQASAANLLYLNQVVAYITGHQEKQLRSVVVESTGSAEKKNEAKQELLKMGYCMSVYKVELAPGSGVYAPKDFLSDLSRDFKKKPKEMVRRLLRLLVGTELLATCSANGEGNHTAIPQDIKAAVQGWVEKHCGKDKILTTSEYNRCINLMCGTLRYVKKSSKEATSNGTPTEGTITKDTLTKGTPTKGTPTKGTPTKGTPTKGTPTKGTPTRPSPQKTPLKQSLPETSSEESASKKRRNLPVQPSEAAVASTSIIPTPLKTPLSRSLFKEGGIVATSPNWSVDSVNATSKVNLPTVDADSTKKKLSFEAAGPSSNAGSNTSLSYQQYQPHEAWPYSGPHQYYPPYNAQYHNYQQPPQHAPWDVYQWPSPPQPSNDIQSGNGQNFLNL